MSTSLTRWPVTTEPTGNHSGTALGQPAMAGGVPCKGTPASQAADRNRHEFRSPKRREAVRRRARIRADLDAIKLARGCADCGYNAHAVALDFDHMPGQTKLLGVSRAMRDAKRGRALEEIAKCEVVCANCHRVRTHRRRGVGGEVV